MHLEAFLKQWSLSLRCLKDIPEKHDAFRYFDKSEIGNRGICNAILCNPSGALKHFPYFCDAVAEFKTAKPELEKIFQSIMVTFRDSIGAQWSKYYAAFPEDLRRDLTNRFGL